MRIADFFALAWELIGCSRSLCKKLLSYGLLILVGSQTAMQVTSNDFGRFFVF
jgi:hypothetical protein